MGAPQWIYLCLMGIGIYINFIKHGQPRKPYDFNDACMGALIGVGLMYWGGFFGG